MRAKTTVGVKGYDLLELADGSPRTIDGRVLTAALYRRVDVDDAPFEAVAADHGITVMAVIQAVGYERRRRRSGRRRQSTQEREARKDTAVRQQNRALRNYYEAVHRYADRADQRIDALSAERDELLARVSALELEVQELRQLQRNEQEIAE